MDKGTVPVPKRVVAADGMEEERPAQPSEVRRVGKRPTLIRISAGAATVEIAAAGDDAELLLGPYRQKESSGSLQSRHVAPRI